MSILRKVPKIEQVLDNMSIESLKRLESLMNSGNGATETYTLFGGENKLNYVNKDLGVWYCNIELERNKSVETGFLIWESETKALFVSFDITQCLKEYEIDLTNYTFVLINEKLSIEEFRRVLEDNINKEVVHIDTTGNVEVGKNLVVDGKVILNGKEDLVDTSGNELISTGGGGSGGEILELNATDAATLINILDGNIPSGVQDFSTNYDLKDYNKVKISMEGMEGYYDVSNKLYMPNTMLQFDVFNNYSTSVGSSLDYVRVHITFYPGQTSYECHKFKLSLIN